MSTRFGTDTLTDDQMATLHDQWKKKQPRNKGGWIDVKSNGPSGYGNLPCYLPPVWVLYDGDCVGTAQYDAPDDEWWIFYEDGSEGYCHTITHWQPKRGKSEPPEPMMINSREEREE